MQLSLIESLFGVFAEKIHSTHYTTKTTKMAVKLAVAPIAWSNDDMPELGGDTPLTVCLRESREAGFCGTELGGKFPRDAASLSPLLAEHNLQLAAGWFSGRLRDNGDIGEEMRRLRTQLQTFAALGTTILFYAETSGSTQAQAQTPLSARPVMPDEEFAQYGEKLTALAEKIQSDYGVLMAYHPHIGTAVQSMRDVDMLMANTGAAVGLLADSGHSAFAGDNDDGAIMIRKHAKRIRHIHCKDVRAEQLAKARQSDSSFMHAVLDGVFTVPGDGCLNFDSFILAAADINYRGWLVVEAEQDPAKANPLVYSQRGGAHLRQCCARAGLTIID